MRRFFQSAGPGPDGIIRLEGDEAHHAAQVIRLRAGEHAVVLNGRGSEFECRVVSVSRHEVRLRVEHVHRRPPTSSPIRLVQAITKGKSFEVILQKAVELGAAEIQPVITERVVARPATGDFDDKREKWQQVAIEAIKQCGAPWLPRVLLPALMVDALDGDRQTELAVVAALDADARHLRSAFETFLNQHGKLPESISIWIGPEGDFTPEELKRLLQSGVQAVTLGGNVLRSETAALYALAVLAHELSFPRASHAIGPVPGTSAPNGAGA